ncbi:MAG: tetratricopeptide repeat protein [Candidatus Latescibacterota bacterium]
MKKLDAILAGSSQGKSRSDKDLSTVELYACEAHVALSKEYAAEDDLRNAIDEMEKAVSLKSRFADLRYTLGSLYDKQGDSNKAQELFRSAIEINPRFFKAHVHLARVLLTFGDRPAAVKELEMSRESCPKFYKQELNDLIQATRINKDTEELQILFHGIIEEKPSSAQISRELAIDSIQNGNDVDAIRELKKAITLQPDYPDLHNYLGIAYGNAGMVDDAIEEFETALKINPKYIKARLNLALLLYENERYPEAKSSIESVLEVQPDNQLANNLRAELQTVEEVK